MQQETLKRRGTSFNLFLFMLQYLLVMALYALAWYIVPQLSLTLFILMSCWHFGETDIILPGMPTAYTSLIRIFYGLSVLAWLLFAHTTEVSSVLTRLVPADGLVFRFWVKGIIYSNLMLIVSGLIIGLTVILTTSGAQSKTNSWFKVKLLLILICCYFLPLLPAFALYFSGWHSMVTLYNINEYLEGEVSFQVRPLKKIWIRAVPFSVIALSSLAITGYLLRSYAPLFNPLPLLFVFLSLITLPHLGVMHLLNHKGRN
ncbi:MAG: hypothetical protein EOP41_09435 [Sphingobacteriaceae bacterium]|nr:MAG: hypothetical protein EOP41_09435 [Sphingobacteriaceae bacterium]